MIVVYTAAMTSETIFTLLGTGSSGGVPRIGNDWGECDPQNPKNRRQRCSMLVEKTSPNGTTSILIDTGPDMRAQLLQANVQDLDAVLLTHSHADHIFGMDDLRQLAIKHRKRMDVYMDEPTAQRVMPAFGYCYQQAQDSSYPAICNEHRIKPSQPFTIEGDGGAISVHPFEVNHGDIQSLGFRFGDISYLPDVKTVDLPESIQATSGLEVLVLDALRYTEHPTHMNVEEAVAFIARVKPRKAYLTNMHSAIDYAQLSQQLPAGIEAAYDGLQFSVSG